MVVTVSADDAAVAAPVGVRWVARPGSSIRLLGYPVFLRGRNPVGNNP
jgi:hypothetical protein